MDAESIWRIVKASKNRRNPDSYTFSIDNIDNLVREYIDKLAPLNNIPAILSDISVTNGPFSLTELKRAIASIKMKSSPGPDCIFNENISNLQEIDIKDL